MALNIRPPLPDSASWAKSWATGIQRNADRWLAGIQNPRVSFKDAAIAKKAAWVNAIQAAIQGDHYGKGMAGVDDAAAVAIAAQVGTGGYTQGAVLRQAKFQAKMESVRAAFTALIQQVRALPAATPQDRENRALTMMRGLAAIGKARRGG